MNQKRKRVLSLILITAAVIVILVIFNIGVFTNVLTSRVMGYLLIHKWIFKLFLPFSDVFSKGGYIFGQYLKNSLIIAIISTLFATLISIPAAYSIVRYHGFGEKILGATLLFV